MGLYNFEPRFEPHIRSGRKQHTIRGRRKYPDEPGDTMHGYTGLRHPGARLLFRYTCVKRNDIAIGLDGQVFIDGEKLSADEKQSLAFHDGFESFAEMMVFWNGRLPFEGHILHWKRGKK